MTMSEVPRLQVDMVLVDIRNGQRQSVAVQVPDDPAILQGLYRALDLAETALYDYQGGTHWSALGLGDEARVLQYSMRSMAEQLKNESYEEALSMGLTALGYMGQLARALDEHRSKGVDHGGL